MKVRKKPIVVDAFHLTAASRSDTQEWPDWMHHAWQMPPSDPGALFCQVGVSNGPLFITTLEGTMRVEIGDWILRGIRGELYPVKPLIFDETYEQVL